MGLRYRDPPSEKVQKTVQSSKFQKPVQRSSLQSIPKKSWTWVNDLVHPFVKDYISPQGEEGIRQYRYKSAGESIYYKYVSSPMAEYLVSKTPVWVAPNVLTLVGFANVLVAYLLVWYWCPTFTESAPRWVWYCVSFLLFTYRTLDNMDGKQARKLGCGSALGLSLDHGCDAVSSALIPAIGCAYLQLGKTLSSVMVIVGPPIGAFFVTWEEFYTGVFTLGIVNGADEGGLMTDLLFLSAAIFGHETVGEFLKKPVWVPSMFENIMPTKNLQNKHLFVLWLLFIVAATVVPAIVRVVSTEKWKKAMYYEIGPGNGQDDRGNNQRASISGESSDGGVSEPWTARHYRGRRPRVRDAFHATLPVILGSALWICSVYFPFRESGILLEHTRSIIWLGVMLFSKLITHLHVAHVCGDPYYQWRLTYMIPLTLITLNALYADFVSGDKPLVDGYRLIIFCALISTLSWAHMCYNVITGMCRVLDIPFLRVPPKCLEKWTEKAAKQKVNQKVSRTTKK